MNSHARTHARLYTAIALLSALPAYAADAGLEQRIASIEQGLLPAITLEGAAPAKRKLADEMARLGVPGVSIAVIHGGEVEWAKAYGAVTPGGAPVTTSTLFQAASISKPVAAMGALKLVEEGKLELDRDVNSYTTLWKLPKDADNSAVTLRQLLSHTAGTTVHGFPGYAAGAPVPTLVQILNGAKPANTGGVHVNARPGSRWRYSGGGYQVAQYVMVERSKTPFTELMQEKVLKPLGMADSTFAQPLPPQLLARAALPHQRSGKPVAGGPHTYPEQAAAGLWTTPSDLAKFAIETRRAAAGQSNAVLSQAMTHLMLTPVMQDYGLGLGISGDGQSQSFGHGGSNEGYRARMAAYTERGDGIVVMTNGDGGSELADELVRAVAAEYGWPTMGSKVRRNVPLKEEALASLPGKYVIPGAGDFTIRRTGGGLVVELQEGASETLLAAPSGSYFVQSSEAELVFTGKDGGRFTQGSFDMPFTRAKE
ncbi:serine hydrolase domain-containing protein [Pseudoduganella aquatica]|uniref:Serine hydrolase n=1 Tax=Pseudoduganella aquatica TaxID=2660641 RepID=A0A7X4HCH4_9BURK|nr:serine hydrolase domain-containing protein [Pseudoduganella aquatica]MYN08669.1 serine hydrolase [Pseudoduganella aquatica]